MSNNIKITCSIGTTNSSVPLKARVLLDDQTFHKDNHVKEDKTIILLLSDEPGEHELTFVLQDKLPEHTTLNDYGQILEDAKLTIKNLAFDDIEIGQVFFDKAQYEHDFNGSGPATVQKFYGEMGCNGTVTLKFTTPMYMWLLENI